MTGIITAIAIIAIAGFAIFATFATAQPKALQTLLLPGE